MSTLLSLNARTTSRGPVRAVGVIAAIAFLVLALLGGRAGAADSGLGYVALGDSSASGVFIAKQLHDPLGCWRSDKNYAHDTAATLGLALTDMTCGGATEANMTEPQATPWGTNPAQLSAITKATHVVSITIGGLDTGGGELSSNCAALTPWGPTKVGRTCTPYYTTGGDKMAAAITANAPKVAAILKAIHSQAASDVKIFVLSYAARVPATGPGCWSRVPMTIADVPYYRTVMQNLNAMLARVAAANGAHYVDVYTPSLHYTPCTDPAVRWTEPILPWGAYPLHENVNGMAHVATILATAMKATGVSAPQP
jgi:hypothetical protein